MEFYKEKLIEHRKQSHLSAEKISQAVGVSRPTYWKWEKGYSAPNIRQIRRLTKVLEISVKEISDLNEIETKTEDIYPKSVESYLSFLKVHETQNFKQIINDALKTTLVLSDKLEESGLIIKAILSGIDTMFYVKDKDLKYVVANDAFLKNLSLKKEFKVYGCSDKDFFSKKEADMNATLDESILMTGEPIVKESFIPGSRKRKWGIISRTPIFDQKGNVYGVIGNFIDITKRKNAEKMLNTLKKCIDAMADGMILQDVSGEKVFYYNKAVEEIFGYGKENTLNKTKTNHEFWLNTCVHPDDREKELNYMKKKKWPEKRQYRIIRPSGDVRWTESRITTSSFGKEELHLTIISDITDRKELETQNNKLRSIIDSSDEVVWYGEADENNNLISMDFVNEALYKITGIKTEELKNCKGTKNVWHDIIHKDDLESFKNWNKLGEFEYRIAHKVTGEVTRLRARNYMRGTTKYGFINDITERRNKY